MFESIPPSDSYDEPKSERRISKIFRERDPSSDIPIDLFQIEEIAQAREEITATLFRDNAPADQWRQISKQVLSEHPRLRDYEPFFQNVVGEALKRHEALEELWEEAGVAASNSPAQLSPGLTEADPYSAERLFRVMFNSEARGKVEATKGKFSLTFVVEDEEDARIAYRHGMASGQLLEETPLGFALPNGEVPVILIKRHLRGPQEEIVATAHESEHIRNSILRGGRYRTLGQIESQGGGGVLEKILKREEGGLPIEELAKDELLAQFTYLQLLEGSQGANPELEERFDEVVSEVIKKIKTIADPNGYYFRRFEKLLSPTEHEKKRFEQSVLRGVDAYVRLWRLYKEKKTEKNGHSQNNIFYRVSNILEQFPLYKWPAVVRLFAIRNRAGGRK